MTKEYLLELARRINTEVNGNTDNILKPNEEESSVFSAFQTFGGKELYPTDIQKLVHICTNIARNHCYNDGNKRTAIGILLVGLILIHKPFDLSFQSELGYKLIDLIEHKISEEDFYDYVDKHTNKHI